jgi:hypothetical protein
MLYVTRKRTSTGEGRKIQSKFDPASQIRKQEKNVVVQEWAECCREEESGGGGRPKA